MDTNTDNSGNQFENSPIPPRSTTSSESYSGFLQRAGASMIDGFFILLVNLGIKMILGSAAQMVFGILLGLAYKTFFESSAIQATPGKALLGMIVVDENFERISWKTSLIRYFGTYLSALILGIGYLMCLFTDKKQTLHDQIARTVVINRPTKPGTNYVTAWVDEFTRVLGI